ncbi:MAG: DUF2080 family transposase-associated protein [Thermoproteota archaeon]
MSRKARGKLRTGRTIVLSRGRLVLSDEIDRIIEKRVTRFGTGAKVDCPKEFLGRRVYLIICRK